MSIQREQMYRFPWSRTDNSGGWVEVTDECDLACPGCYRHRLGGHRPLGEVKQEILACQEITNCDAMAIAGGEPLKYPQIVEVVDFVRRHGMKPVLLTSGDRLTLDFARDLKKAGLAKVHFHVDSNQQRPGWENKTEGQMNELRQHYADLLWELGGVQCGYNVTVTRSALDYLPDILDWCRANLHKVQHISLIAFRSLPLDAGYQYTVNGRRIDLNGYQNSSADLQAISITAEEMFETMALRVPGFSPAAYLGGTAAPETHKYLIILPVGTPGLFYGFLGGKTVELVQTFYHLFRGRYCAFLESPAAGKKLFLLGLFDRQVRKTFGGFLRAAARKPTLLFSKVYVQTIHLQQPNEVLDGEANLCDGCANMMMYQGQLINSCRLDEYRMFGGLVSVVKNEPVNP